MVCLSLLDHKVISKPIPKPQPIIKSVPKPTKVISSFYKRGMAPRASSNRSM